MSNPIWVGRPAASNEGMRHLEGGGHQNKSFIHNKYTVINGELKPQLRVLGQFGEFFQGDNKYGLT